MPQVTDAAASLQLEDCHNMCRACTICNHPALSLPASTYTCAAGSSDVPDKCLPVEQASGLDGLSGDAAGRHIPGTSAAVLAVAHSWYALDMLPLLK
jgi:hypothetical protein